MSRSFTQWFFMSVVAVAVAGCGAPTGNVQVFAEAEETIPAGLEPGSGDEQVQDGWAVTYDKFLISIGNFRAARSAAPSETLGDAKTWVLDMKALPVGGFVLAEFSGVAAAQWDRVGFDLPNASAASTRATFTSQGDFDAMKAGGYSVYFEATLTKKGGQSCKPTLPMDCAPRESLKVKWGVPAGTSFDDCAAAGGGAAGFSVPTGGTVSVKPTIHGDHWFFTNITQGAETTERRAQWIADCDLDRNGETTVDELKMVKASDVFRTPPYNLSGALIPVNTAWDYLEAQARTLGDFQGDGECPTRKKR